MSANRLDLEHMPAIGTQYLRSIRRMVAHHDRLVREIMQPFGLTNLQGFALLFINQRPGGTQVNLIAALDSDAAAISAVVKRLEQRALLTRRRMVEDARANALTLSDDGAALARKLQHEFDKLAVAVGKTIPVRGAQVIQDWLKSVLAIHEL